LRAFAEEKAMAQETSSGIQWDLLMDDERDHLDSLGAELLPLGVRFSKTPTWDEFCLAFAYIYAVKNRTIQKDDNVNYAIGDTLGWGEQHFGEEAVFEWVKGFLRLGPLRDHIFGLSGATLGYLQIVEHQIKSFCAIVSLKGLQFTLDDFLSVDPAKRRYTLGQLAGVINKSDVFTPDFEERLTRFVNNRNRFVHNMWIEHLQSIEGKRLPSEKELIEVRDFIVSLVHDAQYTEKVFRGFYSYYLQNYLDQDAPEVQGLKSWSKYLPEFMQVLRTQPTQDNREPPSEGSPARPD
jgi:hypothetical protein